MNEGIQPAVIRVMGDAGCGTLLFVNNGAGAEQLGLLGTGAVN